MPILYINAAGIAETQKQQAATSSYYEAAIRLLTQIEGTPGVSLAEPPRRSAILYASRGDLTAAEGNYDRVIGILRSAFGKDDSRVANALQDKADFLERSGKGEIAATVRVEADRIRVSAVGK